jgi:hypothetical protein
VAVFETYPHQRGKGSGKPKLFTTIQLVSPSLFSQSESAVTNVSPQGGSFLKKKGFENPVLSPTNAYNANIRKAASEQDDSFVSFKKNVQREHSEVTRGLHTAVDLIKSNDTNSVLFAYLVLKKSEQRLAGIRDDIANNPEYKELVLCLNYELKDLNQ